MVLWLSVWDEGRSKGRRVPRGGQGSEICWSNVMGYAWEDSMTGVWMALICCLLLGDGNLGVRGWEVFGSKF